MAQLPGQLLNGLQRRGRSAAQRGGGWVHHVAESLSLKLLAYVAWVVISMVIVKSATL